MNCPKCNRQNTEDSSFCYECGATLITAKQTSTNTTNKTTIMTAAQKYLAAGQIEKAIVEVEKLIGDSPDYSTYNLLGDLHLKRGDWRSAAESYFTAGTVLRREGHSIKANAFYKKVLNLNPHHADALLAIAQITEEKGVALEALKFYLAAVDSYRVQGNKKQLFDICQHILSLHPDNIPLKNKINELLLKEGLEHFEEERQQRREAEASSSGPSQGKDAEKTKQGAIPGESQAMNQNSQGWATVSCPQCRSTIVAGADFCIKCGYKLMSSLICSKCGRDNPNDAVFCAGCGNKVRKNSPEIQEGNSKRFESPAYSTQGSHDSGFDYRPLIKSVAFAIGLLIVIVLFKGMLSGSGAKKDSDNFKSISAQPLPTMTDSERKALDDYEHQDEYAWKKLYQMCRERDGHSRDYCVDDVSRIAKKRIDNYDWVY